MLIRRASLLCLTIATLLPLRADAYTLLGGQTLGVRDSALHVQLGFPELDVQYHLPIVPKFEVVPRFTFYYAPGFLGGSLDPGPGTVGDTIGANLKYQLVDKSGFHLALVWQPSLVLNYTEEFAFGMRLGFPGGLALDYDLGDRMTIFGGFNVPITALFTPTFVIAFPFNFDMGIELPLTALMNLSFSLELGPVVQASKDGGSHVGFNLMGMFGLERLL